MKLKRSLASENRWPDARRRNAKDIGERMEARGRSGATLVVDKIAAWSARRGSFLRVPRLIARHRADRWTGHVARTSPFCFCRPPGDSALGYWVLFSGCLLPLRPVPPTNRPTPGSLSFDPAFDAADLRYPGCEMHICADITRRVVSQSNTFSMTACPFLFQT